MTEGTRRPRGRPVTTEDTGLRAYLLRAASWKWPCIAQALGAERSIDAGSRCAVTAKRTAKRHGWPWPPPRIELE
jgi:hypothetical protein